MAVPLRGSAAPAFCDPCGPVITAEIGVDHHKITYFGDTVNTTSRLESLSKMLGHPVLISADLAHQLVLPKGVRSEYLGEHAVKGRGQDARRLHAQSISGSHRIIFIKASNANHLPVMRHPYRLKPVFNRY